MKKICLCFCFIIIFSTTLFSQTSTSFISYIEQLQYNDPESAADWFSTNDYNEALGVLENVFCFYRGISRYTSYVLFQGSRLELNKGASDFRRSLTIPREDNFYYTDRALLFIGGIIMISRDDKEVAGRIFEYFINTSKGDNLYYPTALYWSARLGFLDSYTYESYYMTIEQLSQNPKIFVYDYYTASKKTLKEMFKKLPPPVKAKFQRYNWTRDDTDVFSLIEGHIALHPVNEVKKSENQSKSKPTVEQSDEINKNAGLALAPAKNTLPQTTSAPGIPEISPFPVQDTINPIGIEDFAPPVPIYSDVQVQNVTLKIMVHKTSSSGALRIDIGTNTFNTTISTNIILNLAEGTYPASVYILRGVYQATVVIDKNKNNIFSIVVDEDKKMQKKYIITSNGISTLFMNEAPKSSSASGTTVLAEINNLLAQSGTTAAKWFEINPYNSSMGMTPEEYAYYRGVAYYLRFINEGKRSAEYAAQSKSDLEFALRKKDNVDFLVKTELYLAALNIYAYGNLHDADSYLEQAEKRINKSNSYYATIIYWRLRVGAVNTTARNTYYNILRSMPSSTSIVNYATSKIETLSSMIPALDGTTSIIPVSQVKAPFPYPQEQKGKTALKANNSTPPTVPFYANYGGADTYNITIPSIDKTTTLPYRGYLYSGENDLVISSYQNSVSVKIVASDSDSTSLLVIVLQ